LSWIFAISAAACGIGALVARRLGTTSWQESLVYSLGLGFCALSAYVFVLGLAGGLTRAALFVGLAAGWACAAFAAKKFLSEKRIALFRSSRSIRVTISVLVLLMAIPIFLQPLYPP